MKWFYIFLFIALFEDCKSFMQEAELAVECSSTVECGSITLGGFATYPLYFNYNGDDGKQCYYIPDSNAVFGNYAYVSNDKCDCECVRLYEGD